MAIEAAASHPDVGERLHPLQYTARASLLAELSRQTYDSFSKALREAVLNGIDAGAETVRIDLAPDCGAEIVVEDDGHGMDAADLAERFLAVGGSSKHGDRSAFGRIGIGSLALLAYAEMTEVWTKKAGEKTVTRAVLRTPSASTEDERIGDLTAFGAGTAAEDPYGGKPEDHFTRLRLLALRPEAREVVQNPTSTYALIERLRRILPLRFQKGRVLEALDATAPELALVLKRHCSEWSRTILIRSRFDDWRPLERRTYGEDVGGAEVWSGEIEPIHHRMRVRGRTIWVVGFMAAQKRANPRWSGMTARVQNVAVAEESFFGVTNDPGFRKYITGEVFLLGDLDQDRLVNINRTSFNEESEDYAAVSRFMGGAIERFKKRSVARDQRAKVQVRRLLEERKALIETVRSALAGAGEVQLERGLRILPPSDNGRIIGTPTDFVDSLQAIGVRIVQERRGDLSFLIELPEQGDAIVAHIDEQLTSPRVEMAGRPYSLRFADDQRDGAPRIRVKGCPREIIVNLAACRDDRGQVDQMRVALALVLEVSYLIAHGVEADLYEVLHDISGRI